MSSVNEVSDIDKKDTITRIAAVLKDNKVVNTATIEETKMGDNPKPSFETLMNTPLLATITKSAADAHNTT